MKQQLWSSWYKSQFSSLLCTVFNDQYCLLLVLNYSQCFNAWVEPGADIERFQEIVGSWFSNNWSHQIFTSHTTIIFNYILYHMRNKFIRIYFKFILIPVYIFVHLNYSQQQFQLLWVQRWGMTYMSYLSFHTILMMMMFLSRRHPQLSLHLEMIQIS